MKVCFSDVQMKDRVKVGIHFLLKDLQDDGTPSACELGEKGVGRTAERRKKVLLFFFYCP